MNPAPPPLPGDPEPAAAVVARAIGALRALGELGESIADEWQYVNDLVRVHSADLSRLAAADLRPVTPEAARAVDLAIDESRLISDPHRAIDWISTLPLIVGLALTARADDGA